MARSDEGSDSGISVVFLENREPGNPSEHVFWSEGSESGGGEADRVWEIDEEFLFGEAGPLVAFDSKSGSEGVRQARPAQDQAAFEFRMNTRELMTTNLSKTGGDMYDIPPSALLPVDGPLPLRRFHLSFFPFFF